MPSCPDYQDRCATAGPHADVLEAVAREAIKQGIEIKVIEFNDYITPNQLLADGELELVSYQHEPFLNTFNSQRGTNLKSIGRTILMCMGIYSNTLKSLDTLPQGAKAAKEAIKGANLTSPLERIIFAGGIPQQPIPCTASPILPLIF